MNAPTIFLALAMLALPALPQTGGRGTPPPGVIEVPLVVLPYDLPELPPTTMAPEIDLTAPVMSTSWPSGGMAQSVSTARRKGESAGNQAKRHQYGVQALAKLYPPDPASKT